MQFYGPNERDQVGRSVVTVNWTTVGMTTSTLPLETHQGMPAQRPRNFHADGPLMEYFS